MLTRSPSTIGHYTITQFEQHSNSFHPDDTLGLFITVEEVFDNNHRIVSQKGSGKGRFTFSAADSGEHRLCFAPTNWHSAGSYMVGGQEVGTIKIELDMAIGETSAIESTDKGTMEDLVTKVKDLNGRLQDIRREQVFQRVCYITIRLRCVYEMLTVRARNARPSSVISLKQPTRRSFGIP